MSNRSILLHRFYCFGVSYCFHMSLWT
jgi:hypothetical protein